MTELVLTSQNIPGFSSHIEEAAEPRPVALALLEQQLDIVDGLVRKVDGNEDLSPLLDLNPICELTETIEASGANFSSALSPAKQRYLQTINLLADRAEAKSNNGQKPSGYKNILYAMGWSLEDAEPAATTAPAAAATKAHTAPDKNTQRTATENDSVTPRSKRLVRVGGLAALAGVTITELAAPAVAAPAPMPAAKVVARAPLRPGTPQPKPAPAAKAPENDRTTSATASSDSSTAATITIPAVSSSGSQTPTTPGTTIEVAPTTGGAGKPSQGTTVSIQPGSGGQGEATPATPGATVSLGGNGPSETNSSTAPNTAAPNPGNTDGTITVTAETEPSNAGTTPSNGRTITVTPGTQPATSAPGANPNSPSSGNTFDATTADAAATITAPSNSTPDAPTVSIPIAPNQQPNTSGGALEYALQNGSTTDAVTATTQSLLGQGYTATPDSPFKQAVNSAIDTISQAANAQAGSNTVNTSAMNAGVLNNVENAPTTGQATPANQDPTANLSPYATAVYNQLADPTNGLASLPGAANIPQTVQTQIYAGLAEAAAATTPPAQQTAALASSNNSNVTVTPPPQPATSEAPAPPAQHTNPNHAPQPPKILSDRELAIQAADVMIQQGGLIGRQGKVAKILLQKTHWSVRGIFGGPIGNGTEESEGMNPMRSQATQTDVPAQQVLAQGLLHGWGLWQSDPPTKVIQWCLAHGLNPDTPEAQADWLIHSVKGSALDALLQQENVSIEAAADAFEEDFERAGNPALNVREADGRHAFNVFSPIFTWLKNKQNAAIKQYQKAKHDWDKAQQKAAHENAATAGQQAIAQTAKAILNPATYQNALTQQEQNHPGFNAADYNDGEDCAVAAAVAAAAIDPNFPVADTVKQYEYMVNSPKWQRVQNTGSINDLKPGDVFSIGRENGAGANGHTFVYIGNGQIMAASMGDHGPEQESVYFHDDRNNQFGNTGNNIDIFRYVGEQATP